MRYSGHRQSQENVAWVFRLSLWIDPHSGHVRLVLRGSTATTWMPLSVALCVKNFTLAVVKQGASTLAANKPNLLAAGKRPDAHPVVGDEPEDAIVVRLRRVFAQFDDAFRVVGFLRCLGVDATNVGLGGQSEVPARVDIQQVLQIVFAGAPAS